MGVHNVAPSLNLPSGWTGVFPDVLDAHGIQTERGYAEEGAIRPSKITWVFNNATDNYRPTNPTAVTYDGKGGRNMMAAVAADLEIRSVGEAASWTPDQTPDFQVGPPARGLRWVGFRAEGILRRIGQWTDPLKSAMYRQISGYASLLGYWPLEDQAGSTRLTNTVAGGQSAVQSGNTLQGAAGAAGSDRVISVAAVSSMGGLFKTQASAGWQLCWSAKLATMPPATHRVMMAWSTTNGYRYEWQVDSGSYRILVTNGETVLKDVTVVHGGDAEPNKWISFRARGTVSGGTVTINMAWYPQGAGTLYSINETFAGTLGSPQAWQVSGNAYLDGAAFGHVFAVNNSVIDLLTFDSVRAFDGYVGERAGDRFLRLCGQLGIPRELRGLASDTVQMGAQRSTTFAEFLDELQGTEDAMIFDERDAIELVMRTRRSRYNQVPALVLTYPTHISPPLVEAIDDLKVANVVTVRQPYGFEATRSLTTGPMGTATLGEAKRDVPINVIYDGDADDMAEYWLARSTVQAPRYPQLTIDLDAQPGLTAAVNAADIGDRITLTGRGPDVLSLQIIGISEQINRFRRKVTYTVVPDNVFTVGIYDDPGSRYDSRTTTLAGALTNVATAVPITTTDRLDCWSTTSLPYTVQVGGETMTVTAMTAPAGTGPFTQTATVTRSVNGIIKPQTAGTIFQLAAPVRYGL